MKYYEYVCAPLCLGAWGIIVLMALLQVPILPPTVCWAFLCSLAACIEWALKSGLEEDE